MNQLPNLTAKDVGRLWHHIYKKAPDECWPWIGHKTKAGYGRLRINGKHYLATRLVYLLARNQDPGELFVCHKCNNPPCCNPAHFKLGTRSDNTLQMYREGRSYREILSENDLRIIRQEITKRTPQRIIAKLVGCAQQTISDINRGLYHKEN